MKKKLSLLLAIVLIIGSSLAGCGEKSSTQAAAEGTSAAAGNSTAASGKPILIGLSMGLTGSDASGGLRMQQAVTMLVEETNAAGGINGRPLQLELCDNQSTPTGAVNSVNKLIGQGVVAVIGPHLSSAAAAVNQIFMQAKIPFIPGGTSAMLLKLKNPFFFRSACPDNETFLIGTQYMQEKFGKNNRVAILYDTDEAGRGTQDVIQEYCKANGITCYAEGFNTGDKDLTGQLTKIKAFNPDYIMFYGHDAETAIAVRQIKELNIETPVAASSALGMDTVLKLVDGKDVDGIYCITDYIPTTEDSVTADFVKRFEKRWGVTPERYAALHYSGGQCLVNALKNAKNVDDPVSIRDALKETKNLQTVMGVYNCDENGELLHTAVMTQLDSSKNVKLIARKTLG
ncbi:ABC transporter substrate-binding protein [Clostridium sp. KNHs216]|uniref:ABC transporter substrate-binding protein n=1 Tax=Clostridium sp. KNHs216 TaxID=1550235 RepID=UPI0011515B61|nr:ABC transporter substrate-binding protein [Clostridium sp. KNHs216]TQI68320.1 branched-chain amino acid transport system substrate-binding protein [Clostridium sp. KNHs216]